MIEMLVAMAVAAILLSVGVPSFRTILQNVRSAGVASDLTSAMNLARAEAVKRASPVQMCPSNDGAACGGAWTDGWIVRSVVDGAVLRAWDAPPPGAVIAQTPNANTAIGFGVLGQVTTNDTQIVASVAGCTGARARTLALAPSGRVSVRRVNCP
jgi:type IV fimbrial biogenesis protein FimT